MIIVKSLVDYFTQHSSVKSAFDASKSYSQQDFRQTLGNNGWRSRTDNSKNLLVSPDDQWIIKFFHPRRNAAEAEFARFSAEHPTASVNTHIVRTEHIGELKDGAFCVMERLDRLRLTTRQNAEALGHMNRLLSPDNLGAEYDELRQGIDYLSENNPKMLEAARTALIHGIWLSRNAPVFQGFKPHGISTKLDSHGDNIMMRPNNGQPETIVFIDLFQMKPWPSNTTMGTPLRQTLYLLEIDIEGIKKRYHPYTQDYDHNSFS
ncbi:MAG: hypothetical protein KA099_03380 [Alphaproteobacteria bacterium]|nr:hypothetical protein [Alphaproteobacteria bacterium]MBP7759462.1 hypothetical protein [Alphaproteobacteria bacterium]MBP7762802.1 hypothetical protein [Alphaproteobacteria bacterium]MBP7904346.1 hypothetical protein [Alphaproteobacteria bacterium]